MTLLIFWNLIGDKMSCKYKKKSVLGKKYCKCDRDNSVRKISCHCPNYKPTLPEKFKRFIHGRK